MRRARQPGTWRRRTVTLSLVLCGIVIAVALGPGVRAAVNPVMRPATQLGPILQAPPRFAYLAARQPPPGELQVL
jgi:ABC-type proline/glycine betaine transport system permease subunit